MDKIGKEEISKIKEQLGEISMVQDAENNDVFSSMIQLLELPEEDFEVIAPGILQGFQQSVNNPNDRLALVQSINAMGYKAEDLTEAFTNVIDEIDKLNYPAIKRDFLTEIFSVLVNCVNETEGISKRTIQVPIELCHDKAKIPQYAHVSDSGLDVYALEDVTIHPGETVLVPTGIKVALPPGYELQVRPKSGRALKTKLRVANTPGTIDQGYRDEIKVIVENIEAPIKDISIDYEGKVTSILYGRDYFIGEGEKFAQLVLMEVPKAAFHRVDSVQNIGENREGGFGSTGLK